LATPNTTPRLPAINLPPSAIDKTPFGRKALYRAATAGPEGLMPEGRLRPIRAGLA
jgi:hypothetical protein